jgi:hypothetical protein
VLGQPIGVARLEGSVQVSQSEDVLGARDLARNASVDGNRSRKCSGEPFERRFDPVVIVLSRKFSNVEVQAPFLCEGLEEVSNVLRRQLSYQLTPELQVDRRIRPAAEVHCDQDERLVHRNKGVSETRYAAPLSKSLVERLAQHEAYVLDQVVRVALDISGRFNAQVESSVLGELLQHVVEHPDARADLVAASAIHIQV